MSTKTISKVAALICSVPVVTLTVIHWKYGLRLQSNDLIGSSHYKRSNRFKSETNYNNINISKTESKTSKSAIKILSQNIWGVFIVAPDRKKRFKLLISKIESQQPDIVLLQELFIASLYPFMVCGDFEFIHSELIKLGYIYCSDPKQSLPAYFGLNSGLMIYSKIETKKHHSVSFSKQYQRFTIERGFIHTLVLLDDNDDNDNLMVINTHFDPNIAQYQLNSINELTQNIDINLNYIKYIICAGDFNICTNTSMYQHLSDEMNKNIGLKYDLFDDETQPTFRPNYNEQYPNGATFDHIFVNDELKQINISNQIKDWKQNDYVLSDHYGLMSSFEIK